MQAVIPKESTILLNILLNQDFNFQFPVLLVQ